MPVKPTRPLPSRRRLSITSDQVLATAVGIVSSEGAAALSIRRLADACGLTPMAIYRHVRDKDDLLDRVVEQVVGAGLPAHWPEGEWTERVRNLFRQM